MQMHQRREPEVFSVPRSDMETVLSTGDIDSVTAKTMRPQDLAVTGRFKAMKSTKKRTSARSGSISKANKRTAIHSTPQSDTISTANTGNTKDPTTEATSGENKTPRNPRRIAGIVTGVVMVLSIIAVVVFVSLKFLVFDRQGTADGTHESTTASRELVGGTTTSSSGVTIFGSTRSVSRSTNPPSGLEHAMFSHSNLF